MATYFSDKELNCPATNDGRFAPGFIQKLFSLRGEFWSPMPLTSACRSEDYNITVGGHPRSLHVYDNPAHPTGGCCAVDVAMKNGNRKGKLLSLAWEQGWSIGIHRNFLHLDRRIDYLGMTQVIFTY